MNDLMFYFITFISGLIFAFFCRKTATKLGRDPQAWFFAGFLFGIFALLLLLLLPKRSQPQQSPPKEVPSSPFLSIDPKMQELWYYLDSDHKPIGPVSFAALKDLRQQDKIHEKTYVWSEKLTDWQKVHNLDQEWHLLNS